MDPTPVGAGSAVETVPRGLSRSDSVIAAAQSFGDMNPPRLVGKSADGKHLVREHIIRAMS